MRRRIRRGASWWGNTKPYEQGWRRPAGWQVYFECLTFCFVIEDGDGKIIAELVPHNNQGYQLVPGDIPMDVLTVSVIVPTVQEGIDHMAELMGVKYV